jgi:hypothetical protein
MLALQHFSLIQHFSVDVDIRTKVHQEAPQVALRSMSVGAITRGLVDMLTR